MDVYIANYIDDPQRHVVPSGLLVIDSKTNILVAKGTSALSSILERHYRTGVSVTEHDKFMRLQVLTSIPYNCASFKSIVPKWLASAKMRWWVGEVTGALPEEMYVAWNLSLSYNGTFHEKITLVAGGA